MFMRDGTFLPSQNHGHGAAKAARPMAALPHPCTNFAAASVHGAECCRSGELKEHRTPNGLKAILLEFSYSCIVYGQHQRNRPLP